MAKRVDSIIGNRYGMLIVKEQFIDIKYGKAMTVCKCICDCGNEKDIPYQSLRRGFTESCGCKRKIKYVGNRYEKLVVLETYIEKDKNNKNKIMCICQCDCGNIKNVSAECLRKGNTKSCGCLAIEISSKDYTNLRFGKLLTVERIPGTKGEGASYRCICDCGNETIVLGSNLVKENGTKSCGCLIVESLSKDHSGETFGRLLVVKKLPKTDSNGSKYECLCDCGNYHIVRGRDLVTGSVKSCGCLAAEMKPHWKGEVELICPYCKKNFFIRKSYVDFNKDKIKNIFCSKECRYSYRSENVRGENHPCWKGGITPIQDMIRKSTNYINDRMECFKRDYFQSVLSGERGDLVAHHLVPFAKIIKENNITFDNWELYKDKIYDVKNLVTILSSEHRLFHSIYGNDVSPEDFEEFKLNYNSNQAMEVA